MEEEIKDGTVISINDKNIPLKIYNDSIIYIKEELKNFDPRYLEIEIIDNLLFDVFLSKSYDNGVNWTELKTQEELIIEFEKILEDQDNIKSSQQTIENMLIGEKIHLSIWCKQRKDIDDVKDIPSTLYQNKNIDDTIPKIYIKTIIYFEQVNPPFKPTPIFIIKPNSFIANHKGLSESIKIVSNLYWNCTTLNDWIILDKNDGKGNDEINFSVTENYDKEDRYGSIIFSSPDYDKEFEITIIQNIANTDDFIELDYEVKNLSNEMQSFVFNIISNTDWLISLNSNDSWIKISPRNGNGNSEILCIVDKNINGKKTSSIKIETKDKKITKYLTINQDIIYDGTGRLLASDYLLMGLNDSSSNNSSSNYSPSTPIYKVITHKYDVSSDSKDLRIQTIYELINQFPKWNFYDNQQVTIRRWLDQCNSLAESYGHTCVYFKTTPVEVSHTLSVNVVRNVVSIKKLHIMFPNNELPQDRNTFTEWDLALQDDFICHIIAEKFEQAFGKKSIPEQKDYLYLPIINKLFRVTSMQPKNGFMGKIGWWEVFLAKYEEDECVVIEDDLKKAMGGFPEINEAMDTIEQNYENMKLQNNDELKPLLDELEIFKTTTIKTSDSIDELSIDEKKKSTQNFTDKLNDSTAFLNVKESDSVKEFLSKRLSIVSINPEDNTFPVTMYNCKEVSKRTVGLVYNINDFTKVNKKSNKTNIGFDLNFNYVLFQKFVGEIFDGISGGIDQNENVIFTIEQNRKKISIILHDYQKTFEVDYLLEEKSFYQICINFRRNIQPTKNQLAIKIFSIADKQKKLEYQNTYIIDTVSSDKIMIIDKLFLYGGQFFINDIELNIDDKNIIMDNVNPVVQMNKFSL